MVIYVFVVLLAVTSAGLYFTYTYWKRSAGLENEVRDLQAKIQAKDVRLERLANMEKMLEAHKTEEIEALVTTADAEQAGKQKEQKPKKEAVDLAALFAPVSATNVSIKNFALKKVKKTTAELSFDLNNEAQGKALSGNAVVTLISPTGEQLAPEMKKKAMNFQIQRFKTFSTKLTAPDGKNLKDFFALRLKIVSSKKNVLLAKTFFMAELLQP